ncbi:ATP synthase F1 subunit delta [Chloroflexota bacterium]
MAKRAYARRYAQAVFEIALEKQALDSWQSDLSKLADLGKDAAVIALLENPKLRFADKAKVLSENLSDMNPQVLNLAYLLVARGKMGMIGEIDQEYHRLLNSYRGIEEAEIITSIPLDDGDKKILAERLKTLVGKEVVVTAEVDASVLGGIIARIGGKLFDGSTRSRLEALKKELSGRR